MKPNLTCEEYQRGGNRCTHNLGLLGICLCDKHYNHDNEEWSEEEKLTYANRFQFLWNKSERKP
jgi:hypothetical protein